MGIDIRLHRNVQTVQRCSMKNLRYACFILLQSLVYGLGNPLTKIAYQSISPFWLLATRFLLAVGLLIPFYGRRVLSGLGEVRWTVWLPCSLCCAGAYITCNLALNLTSATNVGFLMSLPVLFTPLLSTLLIGGRYPFRHLPVQLLAVLGLFLLCGNGGVLAFRSGDLLALLCAGFISGMLVFGERAMREMEVPVVTFLQIAITMVISLAGTLLFDDLSAVRAVKPVAWSIVVYLAVMCTIAAYLLQNVAVAHLSAPAVSMLQCTQPILTALISFLLLGERLTVAGWIGAALIIGCLFLDSYLSAQPAESRREGQ